MKARADYLDIMQYYEISCVTDGDLKECSDCPNHLFCRLRMIQLWNDDDERKPYMHVMDYSEGE